VEHSNSSSKIFLLWRERTLAGWHSNVSQPISEKSSGASSRAWHRSRGERARSRWLRRYLLNALAAVDANRLEQALQNLLHNAMRHTAPGGIIAVAVMTEPETLVLQVKDTGRASRPKICRALGAFLPGREYAYSHGTGLGLALVKEWIEAMGGSVA